MNELFLFVRPPRPLWPFNGPASAFWPPLAFASLAAALRAERADLRVAILDAPALKMGWQSLEAALRRERPAYVGALGAGIGGLGGYLATGGLRGALLGALLGGGAGYAGMRYGPGLWNALARKKPGIPEWEQRLREEATQNRNNPDYWQNFVAAPPRPRHETATARWNDPEYWRTF